MKSNLIRLFVCGLVLAFAAGRVSAQIQPGTVKALGLTGTVTKVAADGTKQPLANGAILSESDTIITGTDSGVVLVFMNGSSVKLGASSSLAIEQFKMDPLGEDIAVAKLTHEPSVSQTTLNLAYGEMVGDVRKLNSSSSYSIKTPAGAAGIRGTTFRITFTPAPDGKSFNFQLSTAEGLVVFNGTTAAAPVAVAAGNQVVVVADLNTSTGAVSNVQVQSHELPAAARTEIQAAVTQVIEQARASAVFTPTEQTTIPAPKTETPAPRNETPPPQTTTPQPIDPSTVSRSG